MPDVLFSAMLNPLELMAKPPLQLEEEHARAIKSGAGEIGIWNIDPSVGLEKLDELLGVLSRCCDKREEGGIRCDSFLLG